MSAVESSESIKTAVRQRYGNVARRILETPGPSAAGSSAAMECCGYSAVEEADQQSCCDTAHSAEPATGSGCGCGTHAAVDVSDVVAKFYLAEDMTGLPESVTGAALGCGNPTAIAGLQAGEVVLDLGSGGGIDCFVAAKRVGPEGRVIGLDVTPDMVRLARRNARKIGAKNVDFRFGEIEDIPLPDASVDVIISNCVINLSPDKDAVFREAFRVLRPGGRISVSDIVTDRELPSSVRSQMDSWAACVAGALEESTFLAKLQAAGFEAVEVASRDGIDVHPGDCGCSSTDDPGFTTASVRITARKPA